MIKEILSLPARDRLKNFRVKKGRKGDEREREREREEFYGNYDLARFVSK